MHNPIPDLKAPVSESLFLSKGGLATG